MPGSDARPSSLWCLWHIGVAPELGPAVRPELEERTGDAPPLWDPDEGAEAVALSAPGTGAVAARPPLGATEGPARTLGDGALRAHGRAPSDPGRDPRAAAPLLGAEGARPRDPEWADGGYGVCISRSFAVLGRSIASAMAARPSSCQLL